MKRLEQFPKSSPVALGQSHRWKVLGIGVAANTSFSAAAAGIPTTAVWLRSGYHLSNSELGGLQGAIGLGLALSELPWGMLTDRLGERPVLIGGLIGTAATLLAMALFLVPTLHDVPSLMWLAFAMTLTGLLGGSVNGASGRAIMAWFAEGERGLAMSIRQTAVPLGGGIGALMLPFLAAHYGFAAVYGVLAAMCSASVFFAARWLYQPPPTSRVTTQQVAHLPVMSPLRDRRIWRVVFGIGILCGPQFAVLTFGTVFLHDFARNGITLITVTMVSLQLGAMVMRVWSGRWTDRHGNRRAYLRGCVLVAAAAFFVLAYSLRFALPAGVIAAELVVVGICISAWHGMAWPTQNWPRWRALPMRGPHSAWSIPPSMRVFSPCRWRFRTSSRQHRHGPQYGAWQGYVRCSLTRYFRAEGICVGVMKFGGFYRSSYRGSLILFARPAPYRFEI